MLMVSLFFSQKYIKKTYIKTLASGYARADGIVAMYIQRACTAKRVYATIVHSATIYDGVRDSPLLAIEESGMTEFLDKFYGDCKVDPNEVEYVEAFGCAIKVIEMNYRT